MKTLFTIILLLAMSHIAFADEGNSGKQNTAQQAKTTKEIPTEGMVQNSNEDKQASNDKKTTSKRIIIGGRVLEITNMDNIKAAIELKKQADDKSDKRTFIANEDDFESNSSTTTINSTTKSESTPQPKPFADLPQPKYDVTVTIKY